MIEHQAEPARFSEQPPSTEALLPPSVIQQLYDNYTDRIEEFAKFRQRPFYDARTDFEPTLHEASPASDLSIVRMTITRLVSPEGYATFTRDFASYWDNHGLEQDLSTYSYCVLTNHRFFSDLPAAAAAVRDFRDSDPHAAARNLLVVSRMIPGMEVDIFNNGNYAAITPLLSLVARQVQSVPRLPDNATPAMEAQRRIWNEETKAVLKNGASTPGNILFIAGSGTHDEVSKDGKTLTMKNLNPQTVELLHNPRLKVIPLFFSCDCFSPEGVVPAIPDYRFLEPRVLQSADDVIEVMHELAKAGSDLLEHTFPKGVRYETSMRERVRKAGSMLTRGAQTPDY